MWWSKLLIKYSTLVNVLGYFTALVTSSPCGISQTHLFREQLANRLSQVFSYQDLIWTGQSSSHDRTSMHWLYNTHCLPRTLRCTGVCLQLPSSQSPVSNDSGLTCGSALSGEGVCWPQGHTRVTCLHPWRRRGKSKFHKQSKKKESISMETRLFRVWTRGMRNVFGQVWHMKVQGWCIYQGQKFSTHLLHDKNTPWQVKFLHS